MVERSNIKKDVFKFYKNINTNYGNEMTIKL